MTESSGKKEWIFLRARKSADTKLSRRILKTCPKCGKEWRVKPSKSWRKYCSRECWAKVKTKNREVACPKCGVMVVKSTVKAVGYCKNCIKTMISERNKNLKIDPYKYETESSRKKRLEHFSTEEYRAKVSTRFKDKHPQSPLSKKFSPKHCCAVECFFRDPRNIVHYCKNISRFVHENKFLFNPEDTIQKIHGGKPSKAYVCNATQGLSQIHRGNRMSWKGWTVVSNREGRERFDLIARNDLNLPLESKVGMCREIL